MQPKLKFISILLLLSTQYYTVIAQNYFHFSHLGVEDGLSQSSVYQIFQDSDGFLWFGTQNGVNRFDGYEFVSYKNEVNNPESLSNGFIHAINEDKNRNLWIGTANGLNRLDYVTGKIMRFYPRIIDSSIPSNIVNFLIHLSGDRFFAISNNSVLICNSDKTVELYKTLTDIISPIYAIAQDNNHNIYIATLTTIFIYSEEWELKKKITSELNNFPKSSISYFLPDSTGLWMGTTNHGIYYFDKENEIFSQYDTGNTQLSSNTIRMLQFLSQDSILIGTFEGLNLMNKNNRSISPIHPNLERFGGLRHSSVHSILIDRDRTLWVGTYAAGISYASPYKKVISLISSDEYSGIIGRGQEDRDGNMWFATEGGGLLFYNPKTTEQKLYPIGSLSAGNREMNVFKTLVIDEDIIYCGTHLGAVYKFYISQQRYELLHNFDRYGIHSLLLDSKRRLWIPTSGRDRLMIFENGKMDTVFYLDSNGEKQTFPAIRTLLELNNNVFILGTSNGGIYLYDKNKLTVEHIHTRIPLGGQEQIGVISSIVKDSSYIYISTTRMGLFRFDHNLQLINQYSYENGITDSFISSLVIDKNNNLWAATGNDIFRLNRDDGRFYSISPTGSFFQELTVHAASVSSDGTLYFPGNRGVASFNPKNLINNPIIPPIFITSLISNNEDIRCRIKDNGNTKKRYSITLNPNENNLTIRYTALNFVHSSGNRYMIKMENIDEVWHNVGDRREVYYSNLRPGHYTFRLRASNNDGVWNPEETTLSVYVESPFYQTNWAYAIYLFLLLSVIFFIERYQRNRLKLKSEIRIKQIEQDNLKELHDERMRMYANFSHELKTPLTLIMNPLHELVRKPSFSQEVRDSLQKMRKNTNKMLELVNKLMDIQKYEAGKSILNKKSFNFYSFIEEIYESFQQTAQSRQINFLIINKLPPPFYIVCFDKTEIEKVFLNLLSNAFKFTPSGGTVTITVQNIQENDNQYLSVEVADTGQGFSEEESKVIFEPFYQLGNDLHKQISGTGIGLSLVRSIVTQHNGLIKVNSQEQVGSTFAILLPDTEKQPANYSLSEKQQEAHSLMEQQDKTTKKTILLVDNEIDILDYLEEKLSPSYFILRAENGKKALSIIEQKIPDLLISDIVMPEMNGIALCDYLKKTSKYSHISIILLTGKSDENQKMEGFDAGADTYITKPFSIDFLKVRIKNLVESREKIKSVYNDNHLPEVLGIDKAQYKNEFVIKYIEFLKANISNQALSVIDICEGLGMSRANFYRKVKEVTQLSPTDLIKLVRLDASVKLLVKSDKNVSEIAQIVGFSNRSFFSRIFKSEYGVSPSEYQKKYRGMRMDNRMFVP